MSFAAITWEETQPAGDVNKNWDTSAISADGQTIIVTTNATYLTVNGGGSWDEVSVTSSNDLAVSGDGQTIFRTGGGYFLSTDGGGSWTQIYPEFNFEAVAVDEDGSTFIGVQDSFFGSPSGVYLSFNGGSTWAEVEPDGPGDKNWFHTAISADGTHMAVIGEYPKVYVSSDSGTNWVDVSPGERGWYSIRMSSDGQTLVLADGDCSDDSLFISHNFGEDWTQAHVSGNGYECWPFKEGVSVSGDGQRIIAGTDGGRVYFSEDGGDSWSETQPTGSGVNGSWYPTTMSSDGTQFLSGRWGGRLYLGTAPLPDPELTVTKVVTNDNGGTAVVGDFPLTLNGLEITSGVATTTPAGSYTVAETSSDGYESTFSGDCAADGTITMVAGETYTCTLTNDDIAVVEEEEEDSSGGSSGSRRRCREQYGLPTCTPTTTPSTATTTEPAQQDPANVTLEQLQTQLIELLKQLLQILLAQQQN